MLLMVEKDIRGENVLRLNDTLQQEIYEGLRPKQTIFISHILGCQQVILLNNITKGVGG